MIFQNEKPDLLELSFELTIYGIMLSVIMPLTSRRLDASSIATICCFLAAVFALKLFLPGKVLLKHFWGRFACGVLCVGFVWWMVYYAENTRAGWYRFHVLQQRVQQLVSKAPAYIITCDSDGYITGASENIQMLVGWRKEEVVGRHLHMFIRPEHVMAHDLQFDDAVAALRDEALTNAGWWMKGAETLGIEHKDKSIVPVKIYAGGIRWSQDIQFAGDLDLFAVIVPVSEVTVPTNILPGTPLRFAPPPPSPSDVDSSPLLVVPGTQGRVPPPRSP
jgi:PAS domain-containing protein